MPKKTYRAIHLLYSPTMEKQIKPGETIKMTPEDAQILLDLKAIEEVEDGSNNERDELGELQDRTE